MYQAVSSTNAVPSYFLYAHIFFLPKRTLRETFSLFECLHFLWLWQFNFCWSALKDFLVGISHRIELSFLITQQQKKENEVNNSFKNQFISCIKHYHINLWKNSLRDKSNSSYFHNKREFWNFFCRHIHFYWNIFFRFSHVVLSREKKKREEKKMKTFIKCCCWGRWE